MGDLVYFQKVRGVWTRMTKKRPIRKKSKHELAAMSMRREQNQQIVAAKNKAIQEQQSTDDQLQDDSTSTSAPEPSVRRIQVIESSESEEIEKLMKEDILPKNAQNYTGEEPRWSSTTSGSAKETDALINDASNSANRPPVNDSLQEGDKKTFIRDVDRELIMELWDYGAEDLEDPDSESPDDDNVKSSFLLKSNYSLQNAESEQLSEEKLTEKQLRKQLIKERKERRKESARMKKADKKRQKIEKKKIKTYNKAAKKNLKKAKKAAKKRNKKGKKETKKIDKEVKKRLKKDQTLLKLKAMEDNLLNEINGVVVLKKKKPKKPKKKIRFYRKRSHSSILFGLIGKYCCACLPLAPENDDTDIAKEEEEELGRKRKWDPDWDLKTVTDCDGKYVHFEDKQF